MKTVKRRYGKSRTWPVIPRTLKGVWRGDAKHAVDHFIPTPLDTRFATALRDYLINVPFCYCICAQPNSSETRIQRCVLRPDMSGVLRDYISPKDTDFAWVLGAAGDEGHLPVNEENPWDKPQLCTVTETPLFAYETGDVGSNAQLTGISEVWCCYTPIFRTVTPEVDFVEKIGAIQIRNVQRCQRLAEVVVVSPDRLGRFQPNHGDDGGCRRVQSGRVVKGSFQ